MADQDLPARYDMAYDYRILASVMELASDGDWVRWDDVRALVAEVERRDALLTDAEAAIAAVEAERDSWRDDYHSAKELLNTLSSVSEKHKARAEAAEARLAAVEQESARRLRSYGDSVKNNADLRIRIDVSEKKRATLKAALEQIAALPRISDAVSTAYQAVKIAQAALAEVPSQEPKPCRVCLGYGFIAQKRSIDDGYGEVDACPACNGTSQEPRT